MKIVLTKGQKIDLTKENPSLSKLMVGLGWDPADTGQTFDLDAFAYLQDGNKKLVNTVYYGNEDAPGVHYGGDNRTGAGEGDDETIDLTLAEIKASGVERVSIGVNIYQAKEKNQNFGQVSNAYIRLVDSDKSEELAKYDLSEDFSTAITVVLGEVYLHNGEWKFAATGKGYEKNIAELAAEFGN